MRLWAGFLHNISESTPVELTNDSSNIEKFQDFLGKSILLVKVVFSYAPAS